MLYHSHDPASLQAAFIQHLTSQPLAVFAHELILVDSPDTAFWLQTALAQPTQHGGLGIASGFDWRLPGAFLHWAMQRVLGPVSSSAPPLEPASLQWRIWRVLPQLLPHPDCIPLAHYLAGDQGQRKRYQLSVQVAGLFAQYQYYRPQWLEDWYAGQMIQRDQPTSEGVPLAPEQRWQAVLWQALCAQHPADTTAASPLRYREARFLEALHRAQLPSTGWPERLWVFSLGRLPAPVCKTLEAIQRTKVMRLHLFLRRGSELDPARPHPLCQSLGQRSREHNGWLARLTEPDAHALPMPPGADTLLGQLQQQLRHGKAPQRASAIAPDDRSIVFHLAHSAHREVEILHDQVLDALTRTPGLHPGDILVLSPDISAYSAAIEAVFGQYAPHHPAYLPFAIHDQNPLQHHPLLLALQALLDAEFSRWQHSELLALLDVPAVRERFALREEDLPTLQRWISESGIRWGLDAPQRTRLELPDGLHQHTWQFGLQRMLLGYVTDQHSAWHEIEPYPEVAGLEAALAGKLAQLIDAIQRLQTQLLQATHAAQWQTRFTQVLDDFFAPNSEAEIALLSALRQALTHWITQLSEAGLEDDVPLDVARASWLAELTQLPSTPLRLGVVNFASLSSARLRPTRYLCLLGMHDGAFPRTPAQLEFDLLAPTYQAGDPSVREDEREVFLQALHTPQDTLYISWIGRFIRDNSERPACVPVGQLRDTLAVMAHPDAPQHGARLLVRLTTQHPLQPFSIRYFSSAPEDHGLFTYAQHWRRVHQAMTYAVPTLSRLPPMDHEMILRINDLQSFLRHPVRYFYSQRLRIDFARLPDAEVLDEEAFSLDGLSRWQCHSEVLDQALLEEHDPAQRHAVAQHAIARLQRAGRLPLFGRGEPARQQLQTVTATLLERYEALRSQYPNPVDAVTLELTQGPRVIRDTVHGLYENASAQRASITLLPTTLKNKHHHLVRPWVRHLLLCASGQALTSYLIAHDQICFWPTLADTAATQYLSDLLTAWEEGTQRPLGLACKTAFAWLEALHKNDGDNTAASHKAQQCYEGSYARTGEVSNDLCLLREFPRFAPLIATNDLPQWAERLYQPLLNIDIRTDT
ncbi:exodeoxyribonuclease V subunit gamma [Thiorhodospira sibirica]|uniref:exodeoxyribonuclease V subunit gamma n=1 Tax=Thiorhodospira sibirica TaxID=154347 RepID=UPI00022C1705|nr:exodeoxyribonuclease V subunit gamma [Thiorhodospira sibirica]